MYLFNWPESFGGFAFKEYENCDDNKDTENRDKTHVYVHLSSNVLNFDCIIWVNKEKRNDGTQATSKNVKDISNWYI